MRLFESMDLFQQVTAGTRKWERTLEALEAAPGLLDGVAYSIGDSLTYRRGPVADFATDQLVGRRRYHQVLAATGGELSVEVAMASALDEVAPYDDLSDRQLFDGSGDVVTLPAGGILVVDMGEAARILPSSADELVELHVTVEGATFHNK